MSELVDSQKELNSLLEKAAQTTLVAVDTELVWEHTYYAKLGVVQLAFSENNNAENVECHLIDATAVDMTAMGPLLANRDVTKILHDAIQDLAILKRATSVSPRKVFDTRVAAGFAGLMSTISLRDLLIALFNIELDKTETRTDWLRRPLTDTQIGYALDDVRFLHAAHDELVRRAQERSIEKWLYEEMAILDDEKFYEERDPRQQFERIKGRGRLSRRELAILRELTAWREREARSKNRPRGRVISDRMLLLLAQRKPKEIEELSRLRIIHVGQLRSHGVAILSAVKQGLAISEKELPATCPRYAYDDDFDGLSRKAIELLEQRSTEKGIDHALVATRSQIRALVRDRSHADTERHLLLSGWRREFIGAELMEHTLCSAKKKAPPSRDP